MTKTVCVLAQDKSLSKLYLYETHLTLQFKKKKKKKMEECISGHCYTVYIKMSKCSVLCRLVQQRERRKWGRQQRGGRNGRGKEEGAGADILYNTITYRDNGWTSFMVVGRTSSLSALFVSPILFDSSYINK